MTLEELIAVAHEYVPAGLTRADSRYFGTEENRRLRDACARARREHPRFAALVEDFRRLHPAFYVGDETALMHDPCYQLRATVRPHDPGAARWTFVVACISVIAPVYLVYVSETWTVGKGVDSRVSYAITCETGPVYAELCAAVEGAFAVERVPREIGLVVVPDLQVGNLELGEATLYDILFTPDRR